MSLSCLALTLWLLLVTCCYGQVAVIDVSNLAQTVLTATNTGHAVLQQAIQLKNEIEFIKHQLEQLAYDAANLTKNPLNLLNDLSQATATYTSVLSAAEGIGFRLQTTGAAFDRLYPQAGLGAMGAQAQAWIAELRQASRTAMETQAITDRMRTQRLDLERAMAASETAAGHLAVVQASNQLLGIMATQHVSLQQILAASQRTYAAMVAADAASAEAARHTAEHWLSDFGAMQAVQGRGIPSFR